MRKNAKKTKTRVERMIPHAPPMVIHVAPLVVMPRTPPRLLRPANVDAPGSASSSSVSSWDSAWNHSIWDEDGIFGRVGFRRNPNRGPRTNAFSD
mmetsp:Transcript_20587/g.37173  ORF Transcript_20587/g.37173 Transcript_20587/m.37173 type:complete len:95 (-) Transcript_20587:32-316(-)